MLKTHEIFARMPADMALGMITFLHEKESTVYKITLQSLAQFYKLRPVFIERKPRKDQHAWISTQLKKRAHDAITAQALQIWLVGAHKDLLCDFLDGFQIPHDQNGTIDTLPPSPSAAEISPVVDTLLAKYPTPLVAIYLHAFQSMDNSGWSGLAEVLASDSRLALSAPQA